MKQSTGITLRVVAAAVLLLAGPAMAAKDTLVFAVAPGDAPEAAGFYNPLLDLMAKAAGKKIVLEVAPNPVEYARNMRSGTYDLIFDAPHFAAWRMARAGHVGLARLPGESRFVVATRVDGPKSIDELAAGRRICVLPSPQLSNLAFERLFQNPARQPVMAVVRSAADLKECLVSKKAEAAVFPEEMWEGIDNKEFRALTLPASAALPARTLTASGQLEADLRARIGAALLSEEGTKALAPLLKHYKAEKLVPVDVKAYEAAGALLEQAAGFQ